MKTEARLQLKTAILIFFVIMFGSLGNIFLSKGMKQVGTFSSWRPSDVMPFLGRALESGMVWIGILLLILFFVAYTLVLSWADYSFVQPASSIGYGVVAILGYFLLGEAVTSLRWIGVAVICLGVFLVSQTPPRTTEQA
jgi:drug/metabolite transporter (DMT)-like permease